MHRFLFYHQNSTSVLFGAVLLLMLVLTMICRDSLFCGWKHGSNNTTNVTLVQHSRKNSFLLKNPWKLNRKLKQEIEPLSLIPNHSKDTAALNRTRDKSPNYLKQSWSDCAQFYCKYRLQNGTVYLNNPGGPNNVPWCYDVLADRLAAFQSVAINMKPKLAFYLIFGTLLGSFQSKEIFPWTVDVDLALSSDLFNRLLSDANTLHIFRENGFVLYRGGERLIRGCFTGPPLNAPFVPKSKRARHQHDFLKTNVYFDLYLEFPLKSAKDILLINPSECRFSRTDIYPLKHCQLYGQDFFCPQNSEDILRLHYGPSFNRPLDSLIQKQVDAFGCPPKST